MTSTENKVTCLAIGDPHFQVKNILDAEELIKKVNKLVTQLQPTFVVILGDLLHTHEKIHVSPFNTATRLITSLARKVLVFLIIGNHDYCVSKDTPILMWDGSTTLSQYITIGDKLIGDDGTLRTVQKLTQGTAKMYTITQKKGMQYTVTENHKLSLKCGYHKSKFWNNTKQRWTVKWLDSNDYHLHSKFFRTELDAIKYLKTIPNMDVIDITVKDYLQIPRNVQDRLYNYRSTAVQWPKRAVEIDPYILGTWIGDGCKTGKAFASADVIIIYSWILWGLQNNCQIVHSGQYNYYVKNSNAYSENGLNTLNSSCYTCRACQGHIERYGRAPSLACANSNELKRLLRGENDIYTYLSTGASSEQLASLNDKVLIKELYYKRSDIEDSTVILRHDLPRINSNPLRELLNRYDLCNNKHIPRQYLVNDIDTRLQLLAGLIDTDGTVFKDRRNVSFTQGGCNQHICGDVLYLCRSLGFAAYLTRTPIATMVQISGEVELIPARLSRKKCIPIINDGIDSRGRVCADKSRTSITITPSSETEYVGWELDGNHRFLLGDFTVTHNCNNQQFLTNKHPFNSFKKVENVTVCDRVILRTIHGLKFVFCPYVPPERFEEALDTIEDKGRTWDDAECIFAHQEFYGCRFNPVMTSTIGDIWPEEYPLVVSGHIHNEQRLQSNIYYTGSSMQHAFGETANKTIAFLTFTANTKFKLQKIDLEMRKKKIVYLNVENADKFTPETNTDIKLVLKGRSEQFKVFRGGQTYKDLQKMGIMVSFIPKDDIQTNRVVQKRDVLDILKDMIKDDDKYVRGAFDELYA
uniref:DNA repair exonuclease n=1 Tax=Marseillevirus LCMAC201 TaxID=2506605 RepID=A0A481YW46_9VIRU|nr:MAG: DNA repair exonuclease [Marseillevirus LCMAC201]